MSFVLVAALGAGAVGCTPKPDSATPAAEDFLQAFQEHDTATITSLVDQPSAAASSIDKAFSGLQAESLTATLNEVNQSGNTATANYTLTWQLPRERELSYDAQLVLTQASENWQVRWQPSVIHPSLGASQNLELRPVPARKANVISSDGTVLLRPGAAYRLLVDTAEMASAEETARAVSHALAAAREEDRSVATRDPEALREALDQAAGVYSVALLPSGPSETVANHLQDVPGVRLNEEASLVSADPTFAPDIMARVGEVVGDELDGSNGWKVSKVNVEGVALDDIEYHAPTPASAVHVSLDVGVQRAAELALEPVAGYQAVVVALRPSTGQILALAQTPAADREGNIATMGLYPPGSVFKIVTVAAGMEGEGYSPYSIVPCPGVMDIYGRYVTNYQGFALGDVPLRTAFANSCNTTFAHMSTEMEPGELADVGKQFGLGVNYRIAGLDTVTGVVPEGETPLERTEAGYGQGDDLASPFGLALVAATAARGEVPVPYLIEGEETLVDEPVAPLEPETTEGLQQMMRAVVTDGTARSLSAGGQIYGKTGEAEVNQGSHSWFAGYRDDIAFATLVVFGGGSEAAVSITNRFFLNLDQGV